MTYSDPYDRIKKALPGTILELLPKLHVSRTTLNRWLAAKHGTLWHIGAWKRNERGNAFMGIYMVGVGPDVPCTLQPDKRNAAVKRHRAKARKDGSYTHTLAAERARYWAKKAAARGDKTLNLTAGVTK